MTKLLEYEVSPVINGDHREVLISKVNTPVHLRVKDKPKWNMPAGNPAQDVRLQMRRLVSQTSL